MAGMANGKTSFEAKPRYEILDGLRGVAAMIVVAFHLFETYSSGPSNQILNHGYLAVDFFFVLSGFVIGYAYDDRWSRMSTLTFFKRRLVRLHPLLIFGTLFGGLLFYFGDCEAFSLVRQSPWWKVALLTLLGMTMLPALPKWDIRGWSEMNSLNGATWSLFWEYIGNIVYALFVRRLKLVGLTVLVGICAVMTLLLTLNIDIFGLLANRTDAANTVIGGFGLSPDQVYIGLTRLFYPFFCGLLISKLFARLRSICPEARILNQPLCGGFWWCSLAVALVLVAPHIPGGTHGTPTSLNGIYCAIAILLIFPLVVVAGASSKVTDSRSAAVCKFLGDISYPLYVTHYPLIYVQMAWASKHQNLPASTHVIVAVGIYFIALFLAYASFKLYDVPVRNWLKRRFL